MKRLIVFGIAFLPVAVSFSLAQTDEQELFRSFDRVLEKVSSIRGLETLAPIRRSIRTKAEIKQYLLESVWDSEADAVEFFEAYSRPVPLKYTGLQGRMFNGSDLDRKWASAGSRVLIRRSGPRVSVREIRSADVSAGLTGSKHPAYDDD